MSYLKKRIERGFYGLSGYKQMTFERIENRFQSCKHD